MEAIPELTFEELVVRKSQVNCQVMAFILLLQRLLKPLKVGTTWSYFPITSIKKSLEITTQFVIFSSDDLNLIKFTTITQSMIDGDSEIIGRIDHSQVEIVTFSQFNSGKNVLLKSRENKGSQHLHWKSRNLSFDKVIRWIVKIGSNTTYSRTLTTNFDR